VLYGSNFLCSKVNGHSLTSLKIYGTKLIPPKSVHLNTKNTISPEK
jgi:hypothetical protein